MSVFIQYIYLGQREQQEFAINLPPTDIPEGLGDYSHTTVKRGIIMCCSEQACC